MKVPDPQRSRVVLIGASTFTDELLPDRPDLRGSVVELARILRDPHAGIVAEANCRVVLNEPSVPKIAAALTAASREATDLLLVYFAGHGIIQAHRNDLYLASSEARRHDPEQGALKYDFLRDAVRDSPAATKVIIFDCDFLSSDRSEVALPQITADGVHVVTGNLLKPLQEGTSEDRPYITLGSAYSSSDLPESLVIGRNVHYRKAEPASRRLVLVGAAAVVVAGVAVWEILRSDDPADRPPPQGSSLGTVAAQPASPAPLPARIALDHSGRVTSIATSRDGTRIVTSTDEGKIHVWNAATGARIRTLADREAFTTSVALHPDGRTLVAVGEVPDHSGHVWDIVTGKRLPKTVIGGAFSAFNHDGSLLFTADGYEWARLWSGTTFRQVGNPMKNGEPVSGAAFSPDGKTLAVASWDQQVRRWDLEGRLRPSFRTARSMVYSVAFSPDGKLLAVGQDAGLVQIMDARTGKQLKRLLVRSPGSDNVTMSLEFSADGQILLVASDNGPVALLRTTDFRDLKARINAQAPATFSADGTAVLLTYGGTVEITPLTDLPPPPGTPPG